MNNFTPASVPQFYRCAHYGRYSTQMQRPASLDDQERVCRDFATQQGWQILDEHVYRDAGLSGTSKVKRKGLAALEADAQRHPRPFDYILFDDTSRLSRNLGDVLAFEKLMGHYGIKVCFVSQQLDSSDPNFMMLLSMYGIVDAQYITRLRHKVHSAQKGRVLDGFSAGRWPYGYRSTIVANTDSPKSIGRAATKGTVLEVIESEAEVIRRIFQWFEDGDSMMSISRRLNIENIASPRNCHSGKQRAAWDPSAIKRILKNEKYQGEFVWNVTTQLEHPETGKITTQYKPASEHVRISAPHLRIVSEKSWDGVMARRRYFSEAQNGRQLGGFNRAKNNKYLYSGILFCGLCGTRMIISRKKTSSDDSSYSCPNHRLRRGCTNDLRIRADRAAAQITDALKNQLFVPEALSYLVSAVFNELKESWRTQSQQTPGEGIQELQKALCDCTQKIDNLIDAIENTGTQALTVRLAAHEFAKKRIEDKLSSLKGTKKMNMTAEELQIIVRESVADLLEVLKSEVPLARTILQRHLRRLDLFPSESEAGRVYEVVGELDLFNGPTAVEGGVLVGG
jgi:site-specific DNA recombinase